MPYRRHDLFNFDTLRNKILSIGAVSTALAAIGICVSWSYAQIKIMDENHIKTISKIVCDEAIRPICKTVTETNYILREVADSVIVQRALTKMKTDSTMLSLQHRR